MLCTLGMVRIFAVRSTPSASIFSPHFSHIRRGRSSARRDCRRFCRRSLSTTSIRRRVVLRRLDILKLKIDRLLRLPIRFMIWLRYWPVSPSASLSGVSSGVTEKPVLVKVLAGTGLAGTSLSPRRFFDERRSAQERSFPSASSDAPPRLRARRRPGHPSGVSRGLVIEVEIGREDRGKRLVGEDHMPVAILRARRSDKHRLVAVIEVAAR